MNAQELYEEIKRALAFFGLGLHEMDKMQVTTAGYDLIVFTHKNRYAAIRVRKAPRLDLPQDPGLG